MAQYTEEVLVTVNGHEIPAELTFDYYPAIEGSYSSIPENCEPSVDGEFYLKLLEIPELFTRADISPLIPYIEKELIQQLIEIREKKAEL